ncbi:3,4-dihydroxyphenylacetate 2,3-dioxygenase [Sulfolobales archaeon HS-7]|nr:3,4-dihydroxyphenylacetate 2,3-dioxygenase [Sulfolobales archaeon HS-7]
MVIDVTRLSHVVIRVSSLEKAKVFYEDLLGFAESEKDGDTMYLRGIEEVTHHSLVLKKASSPGLSYLGFRVDNLSKAEKEIEEMGLPRRTHKEKGVEDGILFQDPAGLPIFLYHDMESAEDVRLKFYAHKGVSPVRIAHVNLVVDDLQREREFFEKKMGFITTEYFVDDASNEEVIWLTKRGSSHEVAMSRSRRSPGFHHETYYVYDVHSIIRAADILASYEMWDSIERGPGRHGVTQGLYIYLRDQDKNRIEFFTADYEVLDRDKWKPIRWDATQRRYRSDYWGRAIPESWLKEWMPVEDIVTGELKGW